jgi:hypothetical protein
MGDIRGSNKSPLPKMKDNKEEEVLGENSKVLEELEPALETLKQRLEKAKLPNVKVEKGHNLGMVVWLGITAAFVFYIYHGKTFEKALPLLFK